MLKDTFMKHTQNIVKPFFLKTKKGLPSAMEDLFVSFQEFLKLRILELVQLPSRGNLEF